MSRRKRLEELKIGVACYRRDQWEQFLATADDSEKLELTWEEWRENVDKWINMMRSMGFKVVEVLIDIDELNEYCRKHHLPNNSETRSQYVALYVKEHFKEL
ncbi:MAG: hypothetical protein Q6367_006155 [Candidatus Freyarchaeota archaeon]